MSAPAADTNAAQRFLNVLATGELVTFQTFDDSGAMRKRLSRVLHGSLAEHADTLADLNAHGAGVFVMVNEGDGKGRATANVLRVRALFVDLDGAPLEPVRAASLQPHCVVETSPGRWHAYWRISDCSLAEFTPLQKALAGKFAADKSVNDLPRVMRLPGFDHRKQGSHPTHCVAVYEAPPYPLAQFREAFALGNVVALRASSRATRKQLPDRIPKGERNDTLFGLARGFVQKGLGMDAVKQAGGVAECNGHVRSNPRARSVGHQGVCELTRSGPLDRSRREAEK